MAGGVQVSVRGLEHASRTLERMAREAVQMRQTLSEVERDMRADIDQSFQREGPGWAPLSRRTLEDRALKGFPPGPILQRTGNLRRSWSRGHARVTNTDITLRAGSHYAAYHQTGTAHMPARPVTISEQTAEKAAETIKDALVSPF